MWFELLAIAASKIDNSGVKGLPATSSANFKPQASPSEFMLPSRNSTMLSSHTSFFSRSVMASGLWSINLAKSESCLSHWVFNWWPKSGAEQRKNVITEGRFSDTVRSSKHLLRTFMLWKSFWPAMLVSSFKTLTARGERARKIEIDWNKMKIKDN